MTNKYGPQTYQIEKMLERIKTLTPDEITRLQAARSAARSAAWHTDGHVAWDATWLRAWHAARHTAASNAISAGANVLIVANMLGHSDPAITLKRYSHLFNRDQEILANAVDGRFLSAQKETNFKRNAPIS